MLEQPTKRRGPVGKPLPIAQRDALAALVTRVGEHETLVLVGLSPTALARAMAGLPIYPGTAALVKLAIEAPAAPRL